MAAKLFFVYNAESGFFNKLTDFAHKAISPKTYSCSLCALTYGRFEMFPEWAAYLKTLPCELSFIYKNEWTFGDVCNKFPVVALQQEGKVAVLLTAEELDSMRSLEELKDRLNGALQQVPKV
ncbi:hypothetical protein [Pontibacter flavimaris]|uniref:GTPase n=1 Tax=Pontibacter flavimaris TaxID=1797110 RepID=A0A1Q5PDN8_9BACT|nr:hypothetical protein [Pontibacter flavimaris]OKL40350.1 hypothetical protein A3841_18700 [Pontibacter flavimaris]